MKKSLAPTVLAMVFAGATAHADVTIQDQTTLNIAIIKAHMSSTKRIADDKKRTDSEFTCEGFMSMLCGKNEGLEIIRLDESLTLHGDAKKKTYTSTPFPTPEQRKAAEEKVQAEMEKLKSCPSPVPTNSPNVDTSKCELTPPTTSVTNPGDTASFAGHSAHHTIMTMTQSCANKDTGDSCDMAYTFDLWLANDDIPEMATRQTFDQNYMHKLGLDTAGGITALPASLSQFLAPYKDAMKKMATDAGSLKGYPLKSSFRFAIGGPHCAASKNAGNGGAGGGSGGGGLVGDASSAAAGAAASSTEGAASSAAGESIAHSTGGGVGGYIAGSAAGAFAGKMIGGLFGGAKKKVSDAAAAPPPGSSTTAAAPAPANNNMTTVADITIETTAITAGAIPADQFEIPSTWKLVTPKERAEKEMTCPQAGG